MTETMKGLPFETTTDGLFATRCQLSRFFTISISIILVDRRWENLQAGLDGWFEELVARLDEGRPC
jgi:hypothetical protein